MRKIFTFLLFITFSGASAQQDSTCEEKLRLAILSVAKSQSHGRMVLFTKNYIDETTEFLQWLINNENCYAEDNSINVVGTKNGASTIVFKKGKRIDEGASKVYINWTTDKNDKITSVVISGKWNDMVDIFTEYWPIGINTRMDFKKKEVAYFTGINDRVSLNITDKGKGKIAITNHIGNDIFNQYRCK